MQPCPRCGGIGSVELDANGAPHCARCGFGPSLEPAPPVKPVEMWRVIFPLVFPIVTLMATLGDRPRRDLTTPDARIGVGVTFVMIGVWSCWNGVLWPRLPEGWRRNFRPNARATPWLLGVCFGAWGGWFLVTGVWQWWKAS